MTHIDFFSNAPNRLDYVVRLLKKIQSAQQNAVVFGTVAAINALSDALWQLDGFFAHDVYSPDAHAPFNASIVLTDQIPDNLALPHHDNLINLADEVPAFFATFKRLIEVVPNDASMREAARERWAFYKSRGYAMSHHDIAQTK